VKSISFIFLFISLQCFSSQAESPFAEDKLIDLYSRGYKILAKIKQDPGILIQERKPSFKAGLNCTVFVREEPEEGQFYNAGFKFYLSGFEPTQASQIQMAGVHLKADADSRIDYIRVEGFSSTSALDYKYFKSFNIMMIFRFLVSVLIFLDIEPF